MTPLELAKHELIGLVAEVVRSGDAGLVGQAGAVVDETQRTLTLATPKGDKVVPKAGQTFAFKLPTGERIALEGRAIAHRPEERTRKARPDRAPQARGEPYARA